MASKRTNVGRPRLPDSMRKIRITVTLSPLTLKTVDGKRGTMSRSSYIESLLPHTPEDTRRIIREQGAVYTPSALARYVADKAFYYYAAPLGSSSGAGSPRCPKHLNVLDPACGQGELLAAAWESLRENSDRNLRRLKSAQPVFYGIDTDHDAVAETRRRMEDLDAKSHRRTHYLATNALFPFEFPSAQAGWEKVRAGFSVSDGFDVVIANPPWGANTDEYRHLLASREYQMYRGQFDTADLFVELALSVLRPNGVLAFILPDSLFQAERSALRELLLNESEVMFIGRLGEKIFEGINRACVVVVCRKRPAPSGHKVDCLHLTPDLRKQILENQATFQDVEEELLHRVRQKRFRDNPGSLFDIDLKEKEVAIVQKLDASKATFGSYLASTRGVELSKTGRVCQCPSCKLWMPLPQAKSPTCGHCGKSFDVERARCESIVRQSQSTTSAPLLVGESVRRYYASVDNWITTGKSGINYKDLDAYSAHKIVVRKTGVGISASIDYSGSLTNQVVYMMRSRDDACHEPPPLEFFLGVLNSRAMYYYLVKSHGETEWRSHPYVTQQQILNLPVPSSRQWFQNGRSLVNEIAELVKSKIRKKGLFDVRSDAKVERLVAEAFGLKKRDYEWIYNTLDEVQQLLPIRALKEVSVEDIFACA